MTRLLAAPASLTAIALPAAALTDPVHTASGLVAGASGAYPDVRVCEQEPYPQPSIYYSFDCFTQARKDVQRAPQAGQPNGGGN